MRARISAGLVVVALVAGTAHAAPFAYVPSTTANTVSVIDSASDTVVATVVGIGAGPQSAVPSPDGATVYVSDLNGFAGRVWVVNAATNTVDTSIPVFSGLFHLAVSPDGSRLYGAGGSSLKAIDTATSIVTFVTHPSWAPRSIVFHPTLPRAYVNGPTFSDGIVVDTVSNTVITTFSATIYAGITIHPDGSRLFGSQTFNGIPPPGLAQVDTTTNMVLSANHAVTTGAPREVAIHPDGSRVYVSTSTGLSVVDTTSNTETAAISVGTNNQGVAVHPDGSRVYLVDQDTDSVYVISTGALTVVDTIPVGDAPIGRGVFIGPIATCGDGTTTFPETCDDGNVVSGDCCSATCLSDPDGTSCDDGNPTNFYDQCTAGTCAGGPYMLDHYTCYQGTDLKNPKLIQVPNVTTADQLGSTTVAVQKVKFVCTPTDKNGEGISNPAAHLTCYQVKADNFEPRPSVEVISQFQVTQFELKKPKLLCLPSSKTMLP